ncbi:hypothetical protein Fcan01_12928 [Folsomia candida]|uniref:Uncharacterized protein n=1 Tax=Folsomia candida TaxID=158441 RepID=A0A226E6L2_FOLCA|nr:hypothetical protein Fcan01_12928 [Folsomia candida]
MHIGSVDCVAQDEVESSSTNNSNVLLQGPKKANTAMTTTSIPPSTRLRRNNPDINYEKVLVQTLLKDYDISVRPTKKSTIALNLTFGSALTQIIDVVSEKWA